MCPYGQKHNIFFIHIYIFGIMYDLLEMCKVPLRQLHQIHCSIKYRGS